MTLDNLEAISYYKRNRHRYNVDEQEGFIIECIKRGAMESIKAYHNQIESDKDEIKKQHYLE